MEHFNINRRNFLKQASSLAALTTMGPASLDALFPAKPYRVGLIGSGWYGKNDVFRLIQVSPVNVLAIADPDRHMREGAAAIVAERQKSGKQPALFNDYRDMLDREEFDIIVIGSPDHWHALQTIDSLKAGAHVYVQKPISVDVLEGEAMVAAATKHNKVIQVGTQRKSTPHLIDAKEQVVDAGLLGKISHVDMWCYFHMRANGNPPVQPVPDFFDYDLWTGPAPLRPYDGLPHLRWWRTFMAYGNGIVGDMCVHMLDTVRWMLDLGWPNKITSSGGIFADKGGKSTITDTQSAVFDYNGLQCNWLHRSWGNPPNPDYPWAFALYGEKGMLIGSTMQADFIPEDEESAKPLHFDVLYEKEKYPEDVTEERIELNAAPATRRHMINFLDAIANKTQAVSPIEDGHISTASCIMSNLAMQTGRPLEYDPDKKIIKNDPDATALLARSYREPWTHPKENL